MIRFVWKNFLAMVVVFLIHVMVLTPASFQNGTPAQPVAPPTPACTMAFAEGLWSNPELLAWSELANPTLFALPDAEHGFAAALRHSLPIVHSPTPQPEIKVVVPPPRYLAAPELAARLPQTLPEKKRLAMTVRRGDERPPTKRLPRAIIWLWNDGTPMANPPDIDLATVVAESGDRQPTDETRVGIILAEGRLRTRLVQSCGRVGLDQLAMERVGMALAGVASQDVERPRLFGKYLPPQGEIARVDWRLAVQNDGSQ